jgi:hypothetical protein
VPSLCVQTQGVINTETSVTGSIASRRLATQESGRLSCMTTNRGGADETPHPCPSCKVTAACAASGAMTLYLAGFASIRAGVLARALSSMTATAYRQHGVKLTGVLPVLHTSSNWLRCPGTAVKAAATAPCIASCCRMYACAGCVAAHLCMSM